MLNKLSNNRRGQNYGVEEMEEEKKVTMDKLLTKLNEVEKKKDKAEQAQVIERIMVKRNVVKRESKLFDAEVIFKVMKILVPRKSSPHERDKEGSQGGTGKDMGSSRTDI